MSILYYECFAGISGDMHLGALVDLGVDPDFLRQELNKLSIKDEFELQINRKKKIGIEGTKVDVVLKEYEEIHSHKGHHHHRHLKSIVEIIEKAELANEVKARSISMFKEVAVAEAKIHGTTVEEVHFHEVGAVDAIVDIVGAAICIEALGVHRIMSSSVECGSGFAWCAHGKIPVPAPATVEILKDVPLRLGGVKGEATTPTGAAILKSNVQEFTDHLGLKIEKVGYGLGTKDFEIPNVLRVYLAKEV